MKKVTRFSLLLLFVVLSMNRYAGADTADAIVTTVYEGGASLQATLERDNVGSSADDGMERNVALQMDPDVKLEGFSSLQEIEPGWRVKIDGREIEEGKWVVDGISRRENNL